LKHRHLVHEELTAAAIEDILERGVWVDWQELIAAIEANQHGEIAETTVKLCEQERSFEVFRWYVAPVFRRVLETVRSCGMSGIKTFRGSAWP